MEDLFSSMIHIGVIGDYDGRISHIATNDAIEHCATFLNLKVKTHWIPTVSIVDNFEQNLKNFDAFWCAPGSPYESAQGAMNAIQFAREKNYPFIGTCGGFQHVVFEFARDILNLTEVSRTDFDPYSPNHFISALNCSLTGDKRTIFLTKDTKTAQIYGTKKAEERYQCNFGLNDQFKKQIVTHGFSIAGIDEINETRILELPQKEFFIATLFQPQLSSTPDHPHKLILAYLKYANEFHIRLKRNSTV